MYFTAAKRGKKGKNPGKTEPVQELTPASMSSAVEFGGGKPDGSRRFTNNYGKTAARRGDVDTETGEESRRTVRMFNWMKGDSY